MTILEPRTGLPVTLVIEPRQQLGKGVGHLAFLCCSEGHDEEPLDEHVVERGERMGRSRTQLLDGRDAPAADHDAQGTDTANLTVLQEAHRIV